MFVFRSTMTKALAEKDATIEKLGGDLLVETRLAEKLKRDFAAETARCKNLDDLAATTRAKLSDARHHLREVVDMATPKVASIGRRMANMAAKGLALSE